MIDYLKKNIISIPGRRLKNKFVVIESDDWGSIRMPSRDLFNLLEKENYQPERDPYLKYDSLASPADLDALFHVLDGVKDKWGNPAVITANTIMANPDFKKIKASNYNSYFFEHFADTLSRYPNHQDSFSYWKKGIATGVFKPQFHGREHLNVFQWMKALQAGDPLIKRAFDLEMISISSMPSKMRFNFMEGLDFFSEEERLGKQKILEDGLQMFKETFGYASQSFIANCYIWDKTAEETLSNWGVKLIQGIPNQSVPTLNKPNQHVNKWHYMGERNQYGQMYLIRNAFFEPSLHISNQIIEQCLKRIAIAFKWGKPAIIGSHRLNFIGCIHEENREKNLKLFKQLLQSILREWPDIRFVSSDYLVKEYF